MLNVTLPNGITPRDYQIEAVEKVRSKFIKGKKRMVMCLPTGAGKTFIFSLMTLLTIQKGKKVLIIVDRTELLSQTIKSLARFGIEADYISPKRDPVQFLSCYVAMVETLNNRDKEWLNPDLVIIDEAHMGNFKKVFDFWAQTYYLGVTATPIYSGTKYAMNMDYEDIIVPVHTPDLINMGFLAKPIYYANEFTMTLEMKRNKMDFNEKSLTLAFDNSESVAKVVEDYIDICSGEKTLIYGVSINHALHIAKTFEGKGIECRVVHSKMDEQQRKANLKWLNENPHAVLANVDVLTKGFDCDTVQSLIIARATTSLPLYVQIVGRGARVNPNKTTFKVIDHGGNIQRHGPWDKKIDWQKYFLYPKLSSGEGEAPVKQCKLCETWNYAGVRVCTECGSVFPVKEKKAIQGVTIQIDGKKPEKPKHLYKPYGSMSVNELCEVLNYEVTKDGKPYKKTWVLYQLLGRLNDTDLILEAKETLKIPEKQFEHWAEQTGFIHRIN